MRRFAALLLRRRPVTAPPGTLVALDHGPGGRPVTFRRARRHVVVHRPGDMGRALARLDRWRGEGLWVAGWIAYEAAAAFEERLAAVWRGPGALLAMAAFEAPEQGLPPATLPGPCLSPPLPAVPRAAYDAAAGRVLALLAAGDCYQVNLTFPLRARLALGAEPLGLWHALRLAHPVGHAGIAQFAGLPSVLSLSPELFVACRDGVLTTRPMKGTAPRNADPATDAALAAALLASDKARAENLMIVDLLRNDLSRLCLPGSVRVPELFRVEPYATVHQMTSTVTGRLAQEPLLETLVPALFPCGSVTGAPKIRAMEVIREVEPFARGPYCGALGWMAPSGDCDFSVAIRTLAVEGREVTVGVGGGVTIDSTAEGEWQEALWKARFLEPMVRR